MRRISDIDLRLLRVFAAVVEAGGYAAAEPLLNVTSSTISIHISDLEKRLGFRLCERGRSGFRLTNRGRVVYDEVKQLLSILDDFAGSITSAGNLLSGRLVVGTVDGLVTHPGFPLMRTLRRFNALENSVAFELLTESRQDLENGVLDGRIHAAVGPFVRRISGLEFSPLFRERHSVYCGPGHPLFSSPQNQKGSAALEADWVVLRSYHEAFDRAQFDVTASRAVVASMEAMLILIRSGLYIGYLPDHYASPWVDIGELREVGRPDLRYTSEHMLITRQTARQTEAFRVFKTFILEEAEPPAEDMPETRSAQPAPLGQ